MEKPLNAAFLCFIPKQLNPKAVFFIGILIFDANFVLKFLGG